MKRPQALLLTAEFLPVVGEEHPLRKRYERFLLTGTIIAACVHLVGFGSWYVARNVKREPERARAAEARIVKIADLGVPPSLTQETSASVNVSAQVAPPSIGIPEPVPDFQAPNMTIASMDEMSQALTPTDMSDLNAGGVDSLIVQQEENDGKSPNPDDFVVVEENPVLVSITPPVFPEMARSAEAEGVVMVRALIGKDGKIKDAFVTAGNVMLNEAAVACAKTAIFKPALSQHRPVEVWVQIPIRFSLN